MRLWGLLACSGMAQGDIRLTVASLGGFSRFLQLGVSTEMLCRSAVNWMHSGMDRHNYSIQKQITSLKLLFAVWKAQIIGPTEECQKDKK